MFINTNLNITFRKFDDLLQYMIEENIKNVEVTLTYWGACVPKINYTIEDIKNHIKEVKELK